MAKPGIQIGPKIRSDRDFQSRLIAHLGIMNERLRNIQAVMACIADWAQKEHFPESRADFEKTGKS